MKTKSYRDFYEEEKRRHEEALQIYQEDHMNKMEIINLHKRCNKKARKTSQPKNAPKSPEFVETDDSSEDKQKPKKDPKSSNGKKAATKAGKKKFERTHCLKKHQSHSNQVMINKSLKKYQGQVM